MSRRHELERKNEHTLSGSGRVSPLSTCKNGQSCPREQLPISARYCLHNTPLLRCRGGTVTLRTVGCALISCGEPRSGGGGPGLVRGFAEEETTRPAAAIEVSASLAMPLVAAVAKMCAGGGSMFAATVSCVITNGGVTEFKRGLPCNVLLSEYSGKDNDDVVGVTRDEGLSPSLNTKIAAPFPTCGDAAAGVAEVASALEVMDIVCASAEGSLLHTTSTDHAPPSQTFLSLFGSVGRSCSSYRLYFCC